MLTKSSNIIAEKTIQAIARPTNNTPKRIRHGPPWRQTAITSAKPTALPSSSRRLSAYRPVAKIGPTNNRAENVATARCQLPYVKTAIIKHASVTNRPCRKLAAPVRLASCHPRCSQSAMTDGGNSCTGGTLICW